MRYIGAMLMVFFFISCSTENGNATEKENHNTENNFSIIEPGTYKGVLPCADCEGIATTILLGTDSIAVMSQVYLGREETPFMQFGAVEFTEDEAQIIVSDQLFRLKGDDRGILVLDQEGELIDSDLNYTLKPTKEEIDFSVPFYAKGRYFYMADAHVMWLGSIPFPVLQNELNMEAERLFMKASDEVKDEFYLVAKMRIVEALNMEDNLRDHIELLEIK